MSVLISHKNNMTYLNSNQLKQYNEGYVAPLIGLKKRLLMQEMK